MDNIDAMAKVIAGVCGRGYLAKHLAVELDKAGYRSPEEVRKLTEERDAWKATADVASNPTLSKLLAGKTSKCPHGEAQDD